MIGCVIEGSAKDAWAITGDVCACCISSGGGKKGEKRYAARLAGSLCRRASMKLQLAAVAGREDVCAIAVKSNAKSVGEKGADPRT